MNRCLKKTPLIIIIFLTTWTTAWSTPSIDTILKKLENSYEMTTDITAKVKLTQQKVDQGVKVIESIFYRRDSDDSFLIIMTVPDSEKGNGYLKVGGNMWMYRRNTRTFQHITRDERIGGTNARAQDMEKRKLTELYKPFLDENGKEKITEETIGTAGIPVFRFEVEAKVDDVKYPKVTFWVTKDDYFVLREDYYSLSGTLMDTSFYKKYTNIQGHFIPLWQLHVDQFEEGNKTLVELSGISLNKISDNIFDKGYLENLSK